MEHSFVLTTIGSPEIGEPAGTVTLVLPEGANIAVLEVDSGDGNPVTVHLDYRMLTDLMVHAGRVASEL